MRSVESPLSASSLKNCSVKASLDCQPSVLRIDESLSSASLDSVVVPERNSEGDKYTSAIPINSPQCLEADQVIFLALLILFNVFSELLNIFKHKI